MSKMPTGNNGRRRSPRIVAMRATTTHDVDRRDGNLHATITSNKADDGATSGGSKNSNMRSEKKSNKGATAGPVFEACSSTSSYYPPEVFDFSTFLRTHIHPNDEEMEGHFLDSHIIHKDVEGFAALQNERMANMAIIDSQELPDIDHPMITDVTREDAIKYGFLDAFECSVETLAAEEATIRAATATATATKPPPPPTQAAGAAATGGGKNSPPPGRKKGKGRTQKKIQTRLPTNVGGPTSPDSILTENSNIPESDNSSHSLKNSPSVAVESTHPEKKFKIPNLDATKIADLNASYNNIMKDGTLEKILKAKTEKKVPIYHAMQDYDENCARNPNWVSKRHLELKEAENLLNYLRSNNVVSIRQNWEGAIIAKCQHKNKHCGSCNGCKSRFFQASAIMISSQATSDKVIIPFWKSVFESKEYGTLWTYPTMKQQTLSWFGKFFLKSGIWQKSTCWFFLLVTYYFEINKDEIPQDYRTLMRWPGFGHKTAAIVTKVATDVESCVPVDRHLLRVFQVLGWIPANCESEELASTLVTGWLQKDYWYEANNILAGICQMAQDKAVNKTVLELLEKRDDKRFHTLYTIVRTSLDVVKSSKNEKGAKAAGAAKKK